MRESEPVTALAELQLNEVTVLTYPIVSGRFSALFALSLAACSAEVSDGGFATGGTGPTLGGASGAINGTTGGLPSSGGVPPTTGGAFPTTGGVATTTGGTLATTGGAFPTTGGVATTTGGGGASGGQFGGGSGGTTTGGTNGSGGVPTTGGFFNGGSASGGSSGFGGFGGGGRGNQTSGGTTGMTGGFSSGGKASGGTSGAGASSGGSGGDPFGGSSVCTSKTTYKSGENQNMRPGEACIACHTANRGPAFAIAGTVYPTGHEPNDCNGKSGTTIVITDAQGKAHTLTANSVGNFYLAGTIPLPYTAKLTSSTGAVRAMVASQSTGDCNSCHTEKGANGAPGRIVMP